MMKTFSNMFSVGHSQRWLIVALMFTTQFALAGGITDSMTAGNTSVDSTGGGSVSVSADSSGDLQGYVVSLSHDPAVITLTSIDIVATDSENAGAEFVIPTTYADGGTLGVVLDFNAPYDGQAISAGNGLTLGNFNYSCNNSVFYTEGDAAPAAEVSAITFVDGVYGTPALSNVFVIAGLSVNPNLNSGTFTCFPVAIPSEDTELWVEADFGDTGNNAYQGQTGDLCFYYADADDNIQGFTMTLCYDCDLTIGSEWDYNGSIVEEVGVEYLAVQVDGDGADGDGCELVIAILLDALPPFDGQTLPQTADLNEGRLLIGCVPVTVDMSAECDTEQLVEWCNGINGNGNVNLYNNAVIGFESIQNYARNDGSVYVVPEEIFQRGDCNSDDKVDLADSATMLANQFNGLSILCPDACDSNDDGLLNMADSVYLLNWLFKFGPIPTAPGPFNDGADPSDDNLPSCDSDDTNC